MASSRFGVLANKKIIDNLLDIRYGENTNQFIKEDFKAYDVEKKLHYDECMPLLSQEMNFLFRKPIQLF